MSKDTLMKFVKFAVPCLAALLCCVPAKAEWGGLGISYLYGYGGFQPGARPYAATPPYFALHPPVYYGQRYTRPYGVSPFATWPQVRANNSYAPNRATESAHVIGNPHYMPAAAPCCGNGLATKEVAKPVVIENPYYRPVEAIVRFTTTAESTESAK